MVERMVQGVATWHEKGVWSMRLYGTVKELPGVWDGAHEKGDITLSTKGIWSGFCFH